MSTRLYYDNAYQTRFEARVIGRAEFQGQSAVALDRTAFYPTGGGQPCDSGTLNGVPVVDVQVVDDLVWHVLQQPVQADEIDGRIDWPRRWDHMQNHSGQHVLSQAFVVTADAATLAWRLSATTLTIDLDRADLADEQLLEAEHLANEVVQQDLAISARLVDEAELPALALRKQPDVAGPLRIVEIAGFDRVACAGTHVSGTAQVGLVKILRLERRGPESRIHFVCGQRALADYNRKHQLVRGLAARFTCSEDEVSQAIQRLHDEAQASYKALKGAQQALTEAEAARLWDQKKDQPAPRLLRGTYPAWDDDQLKTLALTLKNLPGCFAALAGGRSALVFAARSQDVAIDAGLVLRAALNQVGGRGGGRSDYAQGSAPDWKAAEQAVELMADAFRRATGPFEFGEL